MLTEVGEYIVGAHLQLVEKCDFITYNVRPPGGRLKGLEELDVVAFDFKTRTYGVPVRGDDAYSRATL